MDPDIYWHLLWSDLWNSSDTRLLLCQRYLSRGSAKHKQVSHSNVDSLHEIIIRCAFRWKPGVVMMPTLSQVTTKLPSYQPSVLRFHFEVRQWCKYLLPFCNRKRAYIMSWRNKQYGLAPLVLWDLVLFSAILGNAWSTKPFTKQRTNYWMTYLKTMCAY